MAELHSVTFEWPHGGANNVVLTGTFDHWSRSVKLSKQNSTFKGTVKVPWNEKVAYKFIVDGRWVVNDREPTERDPSGNLNNVYVAPEKPAEVKAEEKAPAEEEKVSGQESKSDSATSAVSQDSAPVVLSDLKQTVVAAEGTSSAFEYLASGVGAAIRSVIGVDPINTNKIPVETPKAEVPQDTVEIAEKVDPVADVKPDSSHASTATTQSEDPVLNGAAADDKVPELSQPITNGVPAPLTLTSNEDNTLSSPAKAAASENGPSTHVPASEVSISNGSAAVTPPGLPVTSETNSSTSETAAPLSTPVASPPKDAAPPASPAKETTASTVTPTSSPPASRSISPAPSTPTKGKHQRLPSSASSESPKSDKSPSKSRSRSIRKSLASLRRVSLKGIFGGKDKEEKEK